jgi:hypothetical protein
VYHFAAKKRELSDLIGTWKLGISAVAPDVASADWGQEADIAGMRDGGGRPGLPHREDTVEQEMEDDEGQDQLDNDSEEESDNGELEADDRVLQEMELMNYPLSGDESDLEQGLDVSTDGEHEGSGSSEMGSPSKRR